ncbi:MAG TPA: hypothetical protein VKD28_04285 [Gemmatimonadales bacterium]|nr:hypothetical protein [Gemmatimonadales bacterium]
MSNPLKHNYFVRRASCVVALGMLVTCGPKKKDEKPTPDPATAPLPTAGLAGQRVALTPLELVGAEEGLKWDSLIANRRATLSKADSIISTLLGARATEVTWVGPSELRRTARRAPGIAADPDQMGTAFLRGTSVIDVPDPLRYQLRTLVGLVGGRYALIPAGLVFRVPLDRKPDGPTVAKAELSMVMVDTRVGKVGWRTIARGEGEDPWTALTRAVKALTPGVP